MALSAPEVQARCADPGAAHQGGAGLGQTLGVGEVSFLPVSNADEFGRVPDRLDADELGLAARLEGRDLPASPPSAAARHARRRGRRAGRADGRERCRTRAGIYIGRHATLAGVPPAAWEPAAPRTRGATPDEHWPRIRPRSLRWRSAVVIVQLGRLRKLVGWIGTLVPFTPGGCMRTSVRRCLGIITTMLAMGWLLPSPTRRAACGHRRRLRGDILFSRASTRTRTSEHAARAARRIQGTRGRQLHTADLPGWRRSARPWPRRSPAASAAQRPAQDSRTGTNICREARVGRGSSSMRLMASFRR